MPERAEFETKIKAARALADGHSIRGSAASAGVNASTLSRWLAAQEPDFMAAQEAVAEYDAVHPVEPAFPDLYPGSRGVSFGEVAPDMNELLREAAGR
jgi:hypothetical protein